MDTHMLMNTQLSHAESEARSPLGQALIPTAQRKLTGRKAVIILAICMALQMTSYVMILPLFARRFSELGAGVASLGESSMAYALAATLSAPFMGALADRFGRRLVVLGSMGVYVLAFCGYLLSTSAWMFILIRGLAGAFTAGLIPAITGMVADLAPGDQRAQWIGIVNGGASVGWIAGPILGGALFDHWGYSVALLASILLAFATFVTAFITAAETHKPSRRAEAKINKKTPASGFNGLKSSLGGFRSSLPNSLSTFSLLLWISFAVMFAWAFIEPRFMFYAYDNLGWTASKLGLVMSTYGVSMTLGEFGLSQLSDRWGRKPVILLGLALFSAQFIGLAFSRDYIMIAAAFLVAGLGNALFDPALSAAILEISSAEHRARLLGIKSTAGSMGSILGPGLIVLFTAWLNARGIFLISVGVVLVTILVTFTRRLARPPEMISPMSPNLFAELPKSNPFDKGEI
jgi:MFS family permease